MGNSLVSLYAFSLHTGIIMTLKVRKKTIFEITPAKPNESGSKYAADMRKSSRRQRSGNFGCDRRSAGTMADLDELHAAGFLLSAKSDVILSTFRWLIFTKFGHDVTFPLGVICPKTSNFWESKCNKTEILAQEYVR